MPAFLHSVFYRPDALPATQPTASCTEGYVQYSYARCKNYVKTIFIPNVRDAFNLPGKILVF